MNIAKTLAVAATAGDLNTLQAALKEDKALATAGSR